ncbi:MAG: stage 0 sporulation family protein [Acholeplasmataceae bacterium]|jgi:cell fate regulator YaaT (PSP1 superfamily)|nr:stage 0 sporulation family protein [Acholeplasmatales bacterium]
MQVCEVQFRQAGKRYYFSPNGYQLNHGVFVVVETVRGIELGKVMGDLKEVVDEQLNNEVKSILRIATPEDIEESKYNTTLEEEVVNTTKVLVKQNELEMKVLAGEYTLDRDRLVIYFEADSRVDFRQLVKDLNEVYKTRIELRQVGSRDGAKFIGSIGPCGLITCCTTYLGTFENVSIKMAKNQNLSLNPQKISGACGKLLCCIKYENEAYEELRENMPDMNEIVDTPDGSGKVISIQLIKRQVRVLFPDDSAETYNIAEVKRRDHKK